MMIAFVWPITAIAREFILNIRICFSELFVRIYPGKANSYAVGFAAYWKSIFSSFACASAPKMLESGLPRLRMSRSFLQNLSRAGSRFSRDPVAGHHRQHSFDPTVGQVRLQSPIGSKIRSGIVFAFDPVGSKECWRWFSATGLLESGEQLWTDLGESPD